MPPLTAPYTPDFDTRVVEMGRQGFSRAERAVGLGVNLGEFEGMMEAHPSFAAAVRRADEACWVWWMAWPREFLRNPDMARHYEATWTIAVRMLFGAEALRTGVWPPPPRQPRASGRSRYDFRRIGR